MSNTDAATFSRWGRLIAERRREKGLTQRQLGDRIGRDVITVSRVERGVTGGTKTYRLAAAELGLDLEEAPA